MLVVWLFAVLCVCWLTVVCSSLFVMWCVFVGVNGVLIDMSCLRSAVLFDVCCWLVVDARCLLLCVCC